MTSLTAQQKRIALIALAVFSLFSIAAVVYRCCLQDKKVSVQAEEQGLDEQQDSNQFLSKEREKNPDKIFFVTCNPGPATHFAALGKTLDEKYEVTFIAGGAGLAKLKENQVEVLDFNPEQLDLTKEEVQRSLAQEVVKVCSVANIVIADVGHYFSIHLQKAIFEEQETGNKAPIFAGYYDNTERWVPGGYSKMATDVAQVSQAIFFANDNLAREYPYQDETTLMDLKDVTCIGVGYYPVEQAAKLRQDRLAKQHEARQKFLESLGIQNLEQHKILVYLGENNSDYFDKSLPKFMEFLDESAHDHNLSHVIVLFQLHPNAKARQEEEKLLIERKLSENPKAPLCVISKFSSTEALILADAAAGRQTSMVSQIALAKIPYMQVGHVPYQDVLVRNDLCPIATTTPDFLKALDQVFNSSSDNPKTEENVLKGLGIQDNWAQKFDEGLQSLLQQKTYDIK